MTFTITAWTEISIEAEVEANSEEEAREKVLDALSTEAYIGNMVGVESTDEDVEVTSGDAADCIELD